MTSSLLKNGPLTIAVFGATGATGRHLVEQACARGYKVKALVRKPSNDLNQEGVLQEVGGFGDETAMDKVVAGADSVICVIGPRPPYTDIFCAAATQSIIEGMHRNGVKRLICQTGAMIGDYETNRSFMFKWMTQMVRRKYQAMSKDRARQEQWIKESDLDWTIVKPSRLTQGRALGRVEAGVDLKMGMMDKIARADLAGFLLDQVESDEFRYKAVFVR